MPKFGRKKALVTAGAASLCLTGVAVTGLVTGMNASAAETPTARELLDACNTKTDVCVFHPAGPPEVFLGDVHPVEKQEPYLNCTNDLQRASIQWSDTTGETNSFGVALKAEYGFGEAFKVSIETSYGHTWETSHTESQTANIDVRPGQKGLIKRAALMQRVKGKYEMHFGDKFYDHYYWYQDFEAVGPATVPPPNGGNTSGELFATSEPMTEEEKSKCPK